MAELVKFKVGDKVKLNPLHRGKWYSDSYGEGVILDVVHLTQTECRACVCFRGGREKYCAFESILLTTKAPKNKNHPLTDIFLDKPAGLC